MNRQPAKQTMALGPLRLLMVVTMIVGTVICNSAVKAADEAVGTPTGLPLLASGVDQNWAIHSAVDDLNGFLYVVAKPHGSSVSSIYKINVSSNSLQSSLSLGTNYGGDLVLSPDRGKAYVVAWTEIIEIDLVTFTVVRSLSVLSSGESYMPGLTSGVAINPTGTALYVVDLFGKLRRVDLVSNTNVKESSICDPGKKPATSPDGTYVYCIGQGTLIRYNALTLQQVSLLSLNNDFALAFVVNSTGSKAYVAVGAASIYVKASLIRVDLGTMSIDVRASVITGGACSLQIDYTNKWIYAGSCTGELAKINLATLTLATELRNDFIYDLDSSSTGAMYVMTSGNAQTNSPATVTKLSTAATEPQSVSFGLLNNVEKWRGSIVLSATASSGLQVAYSSSTPSVCSVSGTTVMLGAYGMCSITGSQSGENTGWGAAENISRSFEVVRQTVSFNIPNEIELHHGSHYLSATATSGGTVTFSSFSYTHLTLPTMRTA